MNRYRPRQLSLTVFLIVLLTSLAACSDFQNSAQRIGSKQTALLDGATDVAPYKYPLVGEQLFFSNACTATLISCDIAITAAHCVDTITGTGVLRDLPTERASISVKAINPLWSPLLQSSLFDIAFVRVSWSFSGRKEEMFRKMKDLAAWNYPRLATPSDREALFPVSNLSPTAVGYGATSPERSYGMIALQDNNNDIDSPYGKFVAQRTVGEPRITPGDSGGPLFMTSSPDVIIGIASMYIDKEAYWADVSAIEMSAWIQSVLSQASDRDGDGYPDGCDPWPDTPNDDQDSDGDGAPDSIDDCPCWSQEISPQWDGDRDGVCGGCSANLSTYCADTCPLIDIDNCAGLANPDQRNRNANAEHGARAATLGDACDPVPGPVSSPRFRTVTTNLATGPILWSRAIETSLIDFVISKTSYDSYPENIAYADYRYCNPDYASSSCTIDNTGDRIVDDSLLYLRATADDELATDTWRRMRTEATAVNLNAQDVTSDACDYRYRPVGEMLAPSSYIRTWDYEGDFYSRWKQPIPSTPGLLWFHANTPVGMSEEHPTGGKHPLLAAVGDADSLSNQYLKISPRSVSIDSWTKGNQLKPYLPFLDCPQCGIMAFDRYDRVSHGAAILTSLDLDGKGFAVLTADGWTSDITDKISSGLREAFRAKDAVWVYPSEANPFVGRQDMPLAVAVAIGGTKLIDAVFTSGEVLLGLADAHVSESKAAAVRAAGISPFVEANDMPSRDDFVPVYSRASGELWIVGGIDSEFGTQSGDIWKYNLASRRWSKVVTPFRPEIAISATWSYADEALWIVDRASEGNTRLVLLDPKTGAFSIVVEQKSQDLDAAIWLLVDHDDMPVLVCSSPKDSSTTLISFFAKEDQGVDASGKILLEGSLVVPPVADQVGLLLAFAPKEEGMPPRMTHIDSLPTSATLEDLAECLK